MENLVYLGCNLMEYSFIKIKVLKEKVVQISLNNPKSRKLLGLREDSNILVIGCEGNADVKLYKQLLSSGRK